MRYLVCLALAGLLLGSTGLAADTEEDILARVQAYIEAHEPFAPFAWRLVVDGGKYKIAEWGSATIPKPEIDDAWLPSVEVAKLPREYRDNIASPHSRTWVSKGTNEIAELKRVAEVTKQARKPKERRKLESKYATLWKELKRNKNAKKLGSLAECAAEVEAMAATNASAAVVYSMRLLALDAELRKYDAAWDDDAMDHAEGDDE